ncbi:MULTISPECIES: cell division protein FtsB [Methylocaldum]|uniref:cell division protein FtsB n=1 Tax=unclassified Methylocaldum TaxID=2622260 RepID=UPI000989C2C4|nr:cell division protein FtsB [Methylocaldum sp. 14B]MBP1151689.1 cell division protein FtsB [Methylocaldum sp. RMAD-M]MVF21301.1 cell division protein FtsB [Methylocaldum sp. BRCS4]
MKKLIVFLLVLIALLQYRLWLGDGGIAELQELQDRIEKLTEEGEKRRERNAALEADVRDLKEGTDAIEERARQELGMIKQGETFVQVIEMPKNKTHDRSPQPKPSERKTTPQKTERPR